MTCVSTLKFDIAIGSCVMPADLSPESRVCHETGLNNIEGFTCPGKETIGQDYYKFPHPTNCKIFFNCFKGRNEAIGECIKGQVFDSVSQTCMEPKDVPECGCWYDCGENSNCPGSCNADCSCPIEA